MSAVLELLPDDLHSDPRGHTFCDAESAHADCQTAADTLSSLAPRSAVLEQGFQVHPLDPPPGLPKAEHPFRQAKRHRLVRGQDSEWSVRTPDLHFFLFED